MATESSPTRYLAFIEGMRGVAALYVVLGHICVLVDPSPLTYLPSKMPPWLQPVLSFFSQGHLAVAAFIAISGFCLQLALYQRNDPGVKNVSAFLARRCRRILPAYYGCLAISIWVALNVTPHGHGMPFKQYIPVTRENVWAHVLMVHNLQGDWMYKLNGVLWSIAIEFQLYFLFPLLARGIRKPGWVPVFIGTLLFSIAIGLLVPRGVKYYPWFLSFFFLGMVAAQHALTQKSRPKLVWGLALLGVAGCWVAVANGWSPIISECGIVLLTLALLAEGTRSQLADKSSLAQVFALRPIATVGAFSYSLYLMHHPILQVLTIYRPAFAQKPMRELAYLLVVGLPAVLVLCFLFALVFERTWLLKALRALKPVPASAPAEG